MTRPVPARPGSARSSLTDTPISDPGVWVPAVTLTDRVVAALLGRPDGRFISRERALDPEHFEFRSGGSRPGPTPGRREDG